MEILVFKMNDKHIEVRTGVGNIETMNGDLNLNTNIETLALFMSGKAPNTLKLTHKTNILPPLLPQKLSMREALVENLILKLNSSSLLHIQGEMGTGKTQLCNLIIKNIKKNIYWFRVQEYKEQLKTFIIELNNLINNSQGYKLFKLFSKDLNIEGSSVLVLDDLPNLAELKIEEDFIQLAITCEKNNIKIISSSNHVLPDRINQYTRFIESVHIPLLMDEEIIELLDSYQAPDKIKSYAKLINIFTDGHPKLVIPTINYLQSNGWKIDFDNFLKNKFIENELQNFQKILDKTVVDNQTKELVYRLNNIGRTVTSDEIQLVSSIEPRIEHPFAKLATLLDVWIFKESDSEYLLSSLLYKLGSKNLDFKVEENINLVLGHNIFNKNELNPYEISKGINYYIKAKEVNTATFRLFQALHSAMYIDDISEDDMFHLHSYWVYTSLPVDIEIGMQLLLRTAQIILNNMFGNDTQNLYEDYLKIELEVINTKTSNPYTLILSYMLFSNKNYKALEYSLKLNEKMNSYSIDERTKIGLPFEYEGIPVEAIFIFNFNILTSLDEFKKWIEAIKKIDVKKLRQLFDSELGIQSVQSLQYILETKLIKGTQSLELQELYILLIGFSEYMYSCNILNSWASLISSAVKCLIEEDKLDEAYILVKSALLKSANDDTTLIITYYLAMRYVDKEKYDKALELYTKVIDIEETLFEATLIDSLTYAPIAFALQGEYPKAKIYIEKVLSIYKNIENYDEVTLSRLYGEYSIILWNLDLKHKCLLACEEVLFLIEKNSDDIDEGWKVSEVILGHCLGYYHSILTRGVAPEIIEDGSKYVCPENRFYLYTGDNVHISYDTNKQFLLYYNLYDSLYQLNDKNRGVTYLHKSFELSKKSSLESYKIFLYQDIYLVENNFVEYFKVIKLFYIKIEQSTIVLLLQLSLLKLIAEFIGSKNKIEEYKTAFVNSFSEVLTDQYLSVMIYTLDILNGKDTSIEIESDWITQRIYMLSEIQNSTLLRAIEVHRILYNDYFVTNILKNSNIIKIEVLENYFFTFWIQKINANQNSFKYTDKLLERLTENFNSQSDSKDKILELLKLVDRYKKR